MLYLVLAPPTGSAAAAESLADAWRLALRQNRSLNAHRLEVTALESEVEAAWAKRGPRTSLRAGFLHRSDRPAFRGAQPSLGVPDFSLPFAQRNAASASGFASLPLWTAGRVEAAAAAADARRSAGATDAERVESETLVAVAEGYAKLLRALRFRVVAIAQQGAAEERLTEVSAEELRQRASRREVLAAESEVAAAKAAVAKAAHAVADSTDFYNRLLGRERRASAQLVEPTVARCREPLGRLMESAAVNRPEIATLRASAEAFEHDAAALMADRWPHLSAEAGIDYEENRFQSPQAVGTAGVFIDWAATDGGARLRKARAAAARAAAARVRLAETETSIADEVAAAWRWRDEAERWIAASNEACRLAAERDRWVRRRFQIGAASRGEAATAATAVAEADFDCLSARLDAVLAEVRLRHAAGLLTVAGIDCVGPHDR